MLHSMLEVIVPIPNGEGIIVCEGTSHPPNIETWPPTGLWPIYLK